MRKLRELAQKPVIGPLVKKAVDFATNREVDKISQHFSDYFEPKFAGSSDIKDEVYKIRHQVYCEELNFEDVKPSGMEIDDCDAHSFHCLIKHEPMNRYAGTVRVVYSRKEDEILPFEKYCLDSITDTDFHPSLFRRDQICEISRLAVPAHFRRRTLDKYGGAATGVINEETYSVHEMRCFPFIAISLYFSAAYIIMHNKIEHAYVMMEPRLARSMKFVGIEFKQIGPVVEYHGKRAPYYIDKEMFSSRLSTGFQRLYQNVGNSLYKQMV